MPFFIDAADANGKTNRLSSKIDNSRQKSKVKRKAPTHRQASAKRVRTGRSQYNKKKTSRNDEEITSSSDSGDSDSEFLNLDFDNRKSNKNRGEEYPSEDEETKETTQEKKLRLAKEYLKEFEEKKQRHDDDNEFHKSVAQKLKEEADLKLGKLHQPVAAKVKCTKVRSIRAHYQNLIDVAVSDDGSKAISTHKDGTIYIYDIGNNKVITKLPGLRKADANNTELLKKRHFGSVTCVTTSHNSNDTIFCTGGADKQLRVWDLRTSSCVKSFNGHKEEITAIAMRLGEERQLFTGSVDKTVKAWDLAQMSYVDTMLGHCEPITSLSSLNHAKSLSSAGAGDNTLRVWKIAEESQLVFNSPDSHGSVECATLINDDHFVSGSESGHLSIWSIYKKKPQCFIKATDNDNRQAIVTAVAARSYTDLLASAAGADGFIRLWQVAADYKSLNEVTRIETSGFISSLKFVNEGRLLVAGISKEHKRGRWYEKQTNVHNSILCIPLLYNDV